MAFIKENHPDSLCIPLEIKKIFMDEQHFGRIDETFVELKKQLQMVLLDNMARFEREIAST